MNLDKLQARKSVLERRKSGQDLPKLAVYTEWMGGIGSRKVLDPEGNPHILDDKTIQSHYRVVTKSSAAKLLATHWPDLGSKQTRKPAKKAESEPTKEKAKKPAKEQIKKPTKKATKKPTKKATKKQTKKATKKKRTK